MQKLLDLWTDGDIKTPHMGWTVLWLEVHASSFCLI